jgi:hypothetical protein
MTARCWQISEAASGIQRDARLSRACFVIHEVAVTRSADTKAAVPVRHADG